MVNVRHSDEKSMSGIAAAVTGASGNRSSQSVQALQAAVLYNAGAGDGVGVNTVGIG